MALNIKHPEVEKLATEVAKLANETKTEAIRRALLERRERLRVFGHAMTRGERLERLLRDRIWPSLPQDVLGRGITKAEREEILGYGPTGV